MLLRVGAVTVLLVLVCLPRFNRMWDPGSLRGAAAIDAPVGHPIDVEGYARLVRYFRGDLPAAALIAPFCYRPLGPALAAGLPAAPVTAINLVNLASLAGVVWLLDAVGGLAGLRSRGQWAVGLLFVFSFPTFYYGTIGFIDPIALATAALVLLLVIRGAPMAALIPAIALATLAKETNVALALLPLGVGIAQRSWGRSAWRTALLLAGGVGTFLLVQALMPAPGQDLRPVPGLAVALENLSRPRTYLSLALTIGVPALLASFAVMSGRARALLRPDAYGVLLLGSLLAGVLYAVSIVGAHTDGRLIWIAYPFLIPIAATWFENLDPALHSSQRRRAARSSAPPADNPITDNPIR